MKDKKVLIITTLLTLLTFIVIKCVETVLDYIELEQEKQELEQLIEMKDSMIADLEENCKDLFIENENLKFGGNR